MLQTYLCGSRKPKNIFCVHTKYRLPERAKFRHTTLSFVSKFPVPYVFSEVNNIKFYTDLSHFANVATYTKIAPWLPQKRGGGLPVFILLFYVIFSFFNITKSFPKGRHKKSVFHLTLSKIGIDSHPLPSILSILEVSFISIYFVQLWSNLFIGLKFKYFPN